MRRAFVGPALLLASWSAFAPVVASAASSGATVTLITLDGAVDPLAARYVERGLRDAARDASAAALIRIDTPGGLDSSMRAIVKAIASSPVPVVCWVAPSGARAASAGAVIMLGCPVAVMAPGTNVGAAHPIGFQGEVLSEKITNDAAAYVRALAERLGRNADAAEKMVRQSASYSAREAVRLNLCDLIEGDRARLLRALDGRAVVTPAGAKVLRTAGARVVPVGMTVVESLLHRAVDPDLAFLLLVLGLAGIVFEVLHPGITVPGVLGGASLLAALVILGMLPVNLAGVLLIFASIGFFVFEAHAPGLGVPAALGMVSLVLGGLFLFDASVPAAQVSKGLVIGTAAGVGGLFLVVVRAVLRARKQMPGAASLADLVGAEGVVVRALDPTGIVHARHESWTARASGGGPIPEGARVRIARVDGLTLEVEPVVREEGSQT